MAVILISNITERVKEKEDVLKLNHFLLLGNNFPEPQDRQLAGGNKRYFPTKEKEKEKENDESINQ